MLPRESYIYKQKTIWSLPVDIVIRWNDCEKKSSGIEPLNQCSLVIYFISISFSVAGFGLSLTRI